MNIITLCGSTKFKKYFEQVARVLSLQGNIILSVCVFEHAGDRITQEQKVLLDDIHKRKIDMSDTIYVINPNGYIGESTASEIAYAKAHNKRIIYMEEMK